MDESNLSIGDLFKLKAASASWWEVDWIGVTCDDCGGARLAVRRIQSGEYEFACVGCAAVRRFDLER